MNRAPTLQETVDAIQKTLTRIFFAHWTTQPPRRHDNDNGAA